MQGVPPPIPRRIPLAVLPHSPGFRIAPSVVSQSISGRRKTSQDSGARARRPVSVTTFVGIRYAAAPIDELRFSELHPPQHVAGVQQAIALPDMCPQAPVGSSSTNPVKARALEVGLSEDCLTLRPVRELRRAISRLSFLFTACL
ncbi:hypothetical protein C8R43DRAFT_984572 [Mycena crocata]|nr:hypothetical protein C8R43DRAFT_984572 [Mycena crocata]